MIEHQCKFNKMIECDCRSCAGCGWHPDICARRLEAIRAKYRNGLVCTDT